MAGKSNNKQRRVRCPKCNELISKHQRDAGKCPTCKDKRHNKVRCDDCQIIISPEKYKRNKGLCNACKSLDEGDPIIRITDRKKGRKPRYSEEINEEVYRLMLLGLTMEDLAEHLSISMSMLYNWRDKYAGFREALHGGRMAADAKIAQKLYKRASGYMTKRQTAIKVKEVIKGGGSKETIEVIDLKEELAPDVNAIKMWLTNRQPERWRDRTEVETSIKDIDLSDYTEEEQQLLLKIARKNQLK